MSGRPKVAFFDLACCEGCQLQVANLGEPLLDLLEVIELVEFREVMSERWTGRIDLAFVEGSVVTTEAADRLRTIRSRCEKLVAFGSCATIGGVNGMRNTQPWQEVQTAIYGEQEESLQPLPVRAVPQVVAVDYLLHGCPVYPPELYLVFKAALAGLSYEVPDYAVCVECKFNENVCLYDKGITCLGPITRAGCNAWCVNNGNFCYGCRGLVSHPNRAGAEEVLSRYGLDARLMANKMLMYTAALELDDG